MNSSTLRKSSRRFEIRSVWSTKRNGSQFGCRFPLREADSIPLTPAAARLPPAAAIRGPTLQASLPTLPLGHQAQFFQDRYPVKRHSMRSVWRPVGVFTPNGLLSGRGRHKNCVERTFCGHLSREVLISIVLSRVMRIFIPINRNLINRTIFCRFFIVFQELRCLMGVDSIDNG